jgi:sugar phosphate isomerase/epimerase
MMELRFACADFTFPLLAHDKALDLIRLLDIDAVDIGFFQDRSHIQPSDVFKDIPGRSRKLRKSLDDRGMQAADLFLQLAADFHSKAINNPDPGVRNEARTAFQKTLDVASRIGAHHVSILPGAEFDGEKAGDSYKRAVDELEWRVEEATKAGLVLGIEAHLGSFCETPECARKLVQDVKGLTLTLDYTHFTKRGIEDSVIEELMPYASHFHARNACKGRAQCTAKDNTIDYPRVMRKMIENNYKGFVGLEYVWIEWEHMNEADNVSETIQLRNVLRKAYEESMKGKGR